ncbi:MAG: hypothetical protein UW69_C0013G0011 [Microgenomates group bacterium GW2011_GWA2_44_7]|nr:MAG: hypothetical protein UW69_C0013G0011 [Microgenomates group bacterium GW2011_GWA2_44_7]KKT78569.1 MAG: hypothetical protein UW73_C0001G0016 [Microgenomates group bacterium GW2011_GWB1_44_8]
MSVSSDWNKIALNMKAIISVGNLIKKYKDKEPQVSRRKIGVIYKQYVIK